MSVNTAHANNGVLIHAGEAILLFSENVTMEFSGQDNQLFRGTKQGSIYLTTHRMIFNAKKFEDPMKSFSFPFICLTDVEVEQPLFGANYIRGKVRAQENGNFVGEAKFKLLFKSGGAIEFAQAMLRAAHMAKQAAGPNAAPPPYTPPSGQWHDAPPPAYNAAGYYGWLPQQQFPSNPAPNTVFMSDNPPPYPGIVPNAGPTPNGYPGQQPSYGGYQQPQQPYGGYPPAYPSQPQSNVYPQVPSSNPGYPPANNGYAPPYGGNVAQGGMQQSSYPYSPPSTAYPPASNPGYPSANPGYPPANPGYPNPSAGGAGGWAAPPNSKEAEAAASGNNPSQYNNNSGPAPPGYHELPPSYDSLNPQKPSKKDQ